MDTSFLLSLAGNDTNSPTAVAYLQTIAEPLRITALNRLELETAVQLLHFRRAISEEEAATILSTFEKDERQGRILESICDWPPVLAEALRLSRERSAQEGHRVLDILHVAAALKLGATDFLSFDFRQRALAAGAGLQVGP